MPGEREGTEVIPGAVQNSLGSSLMRRPMLDNGNYQRNHQAE